MCFIEEILKIIPKLSLLLLLIWSPGHCRLRDMRDFKPCAYLSTVLQHLLIYKFCYYTYYNLYPLLSTSFKILIRVVGWCEGAKLTYSGGWSGGVMVLG